MPLPGLSKPADGVGVGLWDLSALGFMVLGWFQVSGEEAAV